LAEVLAKLAMDTLLRNKQERRPKPDATSSASADNGRLGANPDSLPKVGVLILACFFPPEGTSGAARPFRFYKYMRRLGYCVHVLTAS